MRGGGGAEPCAAGVSHFSLSLHVDAKITPFFVVRSPFRAKHHVVVQDMAAGLKCPLPPCGTPAAWPDPPTNPHPVDSMTGGGQGGQGRIDEQGRNDDITDAARDFALQLP